jgi:Na+-driven multidrug efflux pump
MFTMLISGGANMVLDPLFIFGFGWGIAGAAWATVASQALVVVWLAKYLLSGRSALRPRAEHLVPRLDIVRQIVSVGASEFARLTAGGVSAAFVVQSLSRFGSPYAVAAYGVISRVLSVFFMPMMGISQGLQPILGYNYGAGNWSRAHRAVRLSVAAATLISTAGFLVLTLFPSLILGLFTADPELRSVGARSLRFMTLGFAFIGFQVIGSTLFQALGKGAPALFLSLSRQVLLFLPLVLVLPRLLGLPGVWLAFPAADILSAFITFAFFSRQMRELREKEEAVPREALQE